MKDCVGFLCDKWLGVNPTFLTVQLVRYVGGGWRGVVR